MERKSWLILFIIVALVVLAIAFWDKFIIRNQEIISADYCEQNSDCVFAINPSTCCSCPVPMNKEVVELDEDYVIYGEKSQRDNLQYIRENEMCTRVDCKICQYPNYIKCLKNKCTSSTFSGNVS